MGTLMYTTFKPKCINLIELILARMLIMETETLLSRDLYYATDRTRRDELLTMTLDCLTTGYSDICQLFVDIANLHKSEHI